MLVAAAAAKETVFVAAVELEAVTALAVSATWANGCDSGNGGTYNNQQNGRGSVDGGSGDRTAVTKGG